MALPAVALLAVTVHLHIFAQRRLAVANPGEEYGAILRGVAGSLPSIVAGAVWTLAIATVLKIALSLRPSDYRPALLGLAAIDLLIATQLFFLGLTLKAM
jgi:hypothetical protein